MKLLKLLSFLLFFSVLLHLSCSKEGNSQTLDLDNSALSFHAGAAEREFFITTTGDWSIEANGLEPYYGANMGETHWYIVAPLFGTGDTKVIVQTKEGTADNKAVLVIKYAGKEKSISLTQDAAFGDE